MGMVGHLYIFGTNPVRVGNYLEEVEGSRLGAHVGTHEWDWAAADRVSTERYVQICILTRITHLILKISMSWTSSQTSADAGAMRTEATRTSAAGRMYFVIKGIRLWRSASSDGTLCWGRLV